MTLMEKILRQVETLPPEKQSEVLDFVTFLKERLAAPPAKRRSLRKHPAFGSWQSRKVDGLKYQETLRSEWDGRP